MAPKKPSSRTVKENGDENDKSGIDDEDIGDASQILAHQQDPEVRRELRHQYRGLMQYTEENKEELSDYKNVEKLRNLMHKGNDLYNRVEHTREAALDSQFILGITQLTVSGVRALPIDFVNFIPSEFAEKLSTKLGGAEGVIGPTGWVNLGNACSCFYRRAPTLSYMLGSFQRDPPQRKEKKQRQAVQEKENKEVTKPIQVEKTSDLGRKEATTEEVDYINRELRRVYQVANREPICFFEFIIDPKSFGRTIENMFYVSFLVKDGHCRIFLDDDKLPVIEPIEQDPDEERRQLQDKQQVIMSLTEEEWKDIIEAYDIKTAVLKRGRQGSSSGGGVSEQRTARTEEVPSKKKKR